LSLEDRFVTLSALVPSEVRNSSRDLKAFIYGVILNFAPSGSPEEVALELAEVFKDAGLL